jgi:SAM-dependent methyltransferase
MTCHSDRHSHALVRQLLCGRPSIHDDPSNKQPAVVLDLGCGDGTWLLEAAQCWKNTRFYGLDLQKLHPSPHQLEAALGELAENIKFTYYNFLLDKLPYLDEKFDLVRMANLKWAIPEDKVCAVVHGLLSRAKNHSLQWDFVLQEVNRVLRRGGWVEIIDDDFLLPTFSQDTISQEQHTACDMLEIQFMDMLQARNLLLNTGGQFMDEKLSRWFDVFHEDNFPITIPKTRPVSMTLPSEGVPLKAAKLMGFGVDSIHEKHRSSGSTRPGSGSGSVSSGISYSSGFSWTSSRDAECLDNLSHEQVCCARFVTFAVQANNIV